MSINYEKIEEIPKLGWLATVSSSGDIIVVHGSSIERQPEWMVEGIWDADFKEGMFHHSENFFGSGIRIFENEIYFVASSSFLDRLIYCVDGNNILVSNSLILLMGKTGARLDPNHDYLSESKGVARGVRNYNRDFKIVHPNISGFKQVYYENVIWSSGRIRTETRTVQRKISNYDDYIVLIANTLERLRENFEDRDRSALMEGVTTISSGYDSAAVSCLVKDIGVKVAYTSTRSNSAAPAFLFRERSQDDGTPIAKKLGLQVEHLNSPRDVSEDELYFLTTVCPKGQGTLLCEIVLDKIGIEAERHDKITIVFFGNWGDSVWDTHPAPSALTDQIVRQDNTGSSLSEVRLKNGYINVCLPTMYGTNIIDIFKITNSDEMAPWRLGNNYDRPIPRRVLETFGISRDAFGRRKKAMVTYYQFPFNKIIRKKFFDHLFSSTNISKSDLYLHLLQARASRFIRRLYHLLGGYRRPGQVLLGKDLNLPFRTWIWATHTLSDRMGRILRDNSSKADIERSPQRRTNLKLGGGKQETEIVG